MCNYYTISFICHTTKHPRREIRCTITEYRDQWSPRRIPICKPAPLTPEYTQRAPEAPSQTHHISYNHRSPEFRPCVCVLRPACLCVRACVDVCACRLCLVRPTRKVPPRKRHRVGLLPIRIDSCALAATRAMFIFGFRATAPSQRRWRTIFEATITNNSLTATTSINSPSFSHRHPRRRFVCSAAAKQGGVHRKNRTP